MKPARHKRATTAPQGLPPIQRGTLTLRDTLSLRLSLQRVVRVVLTAIGLVATTRGRQHHRLQACLLRVQRRPRSPRDSRTLFIGMAESKTAAADAGLGALRREDALRATVLELRRREAVAARGRKDAEIEATAAREEAKAWKQCAQESQWWRRAAEESKAGWRAEVQVAMAWRDEALAWRQASGTGANAVDVSAASGSASAPAVTDATARPDDAASATAASSTTCTRGTWGSNDDVASKTWWSSGWSAAAPDWHSWEGCDWQSSAPAPDDRDASASDMALEPAGEGVAMERKRKHVRAGKRTARAKRASKAPH